MTRRQLYEQVLQWFETVMPQPTTELHFTDNFQLLVAVILSAQCTDKRVNLVTPALFERFPDPHSMADATADELFPYISSVSYPNNKTRNLLAMARRLCDTYGGIVPSDPEDLLSLPGVGRKTANVVLAVAFGQNRMAVDTHVFRVSRRIGLVPMTATTPLAVEKVLMDNIPAPLIPRAHHWLILHGRYICKARTPLCAECGLSDICRYRLSLDRPRLPRSNKSANQ